MLIAEQLRHTRVGTREYVKLGRLEVCYVCHMPQGIFLSC